MDKGSLQPDELGYILKVDKQKLVFTDEQIEGIIEDAPKNKKGDILYRELNLWIKRAPKPKTKFMYNNQ